MKKQHIIIATAILAAAFPAIGFAEVTANSNTSVDSNITVTSSATGTTTGGLHQGSNANASVREKIRADYEARLENIKANQDYRNNMIRERAAIATSTHSEVRDIRQEDHKDMKNASTSADRKEIRMGMRLDIFKTRQNGVVRELTVALDNLKQIRERIVSRITKAEQSGRNMTTAKAKLVIADQKIALAAQAIAAFGAYVPPTASSTVTASSTITASSGSEISDSSLAKPRKIAADAIKAIKDARDALQAVVVEIAHNMGLKVGLDGTITATTTASSTVTTGTGTTATTTATSTI